MTSLLFALGIAACADAVVAPEISSVNLSVAPVSNGLTVTPSTPALQVDGTVQLEAYDDSGNTARVNNWSSDNTTVATVSSSGVVTARAAGVATITGRANKGRWGTSIVTVDTGEDSRIGDPAPDPGKPGAGDIQVQGFNTKGLQDALAQAEKSGGGVLWFPAGSYDLRDWPAAGVQVNVPVTLKGDGNVVLQGSGSAHLFDFSKQVHVENLEFRDWLRPIRFYRTADWANKGVDSEYVRVVNSRFLDIAIAIEGRKESGTTPPSDAHRLKMLHVSGSTFERTRRVVDFRRVLIDRFEFTYNQVSDVIHRNPEPDVPLEITSALYLGSSSEDKTQRATEVVIQHNDIRRVRNEDQVNGRAYAILAYRGPTIVENNHIEDVVAGEGAGDGAAAIYQRSYTYARFAHNRVVNGTSTANVAALMAKNSGAPWEVLNNEIIFTDAFKDQHGSPEYVAFEATLADIRFEGNTVRGASRVFVTRMESSNYGKTKSTKLLVRNNTFEECASRPNTTTERMFTIGYRRLLVEVSDNRFLNCSRGSGSSFFFINSTDNFQDTDEVRITGNEWTYTTSQKVPSVLIFFNAHPRRTILTDNRYTSPSGASGAPTTFVTLASAAGEAGSTAVVADNDLSGLRNSGGVIDSRAGLAELLIERNRVRSGGNFVEIRVTAPERTKVLNNNATGISGQLVRRYVEGGELVVSGNTH